MAIDKVFEPREVGNIMRKLEALRSDTKGLTPRVEAWARETEEILRSRSPTSLMVTREAIYRATEKTLKEAMEMEMRIAQAYCVRGCMVVGDLLIPL